MTKAEAFGVKLLAFAIPSTVILNLALNGLGHSSFLAPRRRGSSFGISDFGFLSDFVLRNSDFGKLSAGADSIIRRAGFKKPNGARHLCRFAVEDSLDAKRSEEHTSELQSRFGI